MDKSFKLYSDSKLKSMKKDDLIDYIHLIHNNWNKCIEYNISLIKEISELQNQSSLTVDEIDYLIKRMNFTYKNATMRDAVNRCKSIIDKLEKMKGE